MLTAPIRLAFCVTDLDPGGAERMLVELVCRLDPARWEPEVICLGRRGVLNERLEGAGVAVHCLGSRRRAVAGTLVRLRRVLKRSSPSLLQTWLYHANVAGVLAGRWAGIPAIVTGVRVAEQRGGCRHALERFCGRWARRHICVSQDVAAHARKRTRLDPAKIRVIPNGVDTRRFEGVTPLDLSRYGIVDDARVVLCLGRLDLQKDPLGAVEVFEQVADVHPDVQLVFAGDGPLRATLVERIGQSRRAGRIHVLGWVADVPALLSRTEVLLLASRWEGMPNVVLEALASGRPCVTRPVQGVAELVLHGETGFVAGGNHVSDLAKELAEALENRGAAARLGAAGRHHVQRHFTLETMVRAYELAWTEILEI